jgi:RHS repeat-associated protein
VQQNSTQIVAAYEYGPYGQTVSATGTDAAGNPIRFSTKFHDDLSGLVYYGYRYLSTGTGRWTSRDIVRESITGGHKVLCCHNGLPDCWDYLGLYPQCTHTPAQHTLSRREKAVEAGRQYIGDTKKRGREHCGRLCRDPKTCVVTYTHVVGETLGGVSMCDSMKKPCKTPLDDIGSWHTHVGSTTFSFTYNGGDVGKSNESNKPITLTGPPGATLEYDPTTREIVDGEPSGIGSVTDITDPANPKRIDNPVEGGQIDTRHLSRP